MNSCPDSFTVHQVLVMKIGLAIVLIRQKPQNKSARQYTEELAHKYREKEETWKAKASRLEAEVLRLRQYHIASRVQTEQELSIDVPCATHLNPGTGVQVDDGDGRFRNIGGLDAQPQMPTVVSVFHLTGHEALRQNCIFMSAMLKATSLPGRWDETDNGHGDMLVIMQDTFLCVAGELCSSLHGYPDNMTIPGDVFKTAVKAMIGCFSFKEIRHLQEMVACQLWRLLDLAVQRILSNRGGFCKRREQQDLLSWCVVHLAIHMPPLTLDTCTLLVDCIREEAEKLRNSNDDYLAADYEQLDRVFFIFKALEEILINAGQLLPESVTAAVSTELESAAAGLTGSFPQFVHYVWRLEALLSQDVLAGKNAASSTAATGVRPLIQLGMPQDNK